LRAPTVVVNTSTYGTTGFNQTNNGPHPSIFDKKDGSHVMTHTTYTSVGETSQPVKPIVTSHYSHENVDYNAQSIPEND
jgi:hypothetical protein